MDDALTCVCLKDLWAMAKLSTKGFVILLVSNPSQKIQAVQMVKDFHANSISFLSSGWMVDLEGSFRHIQLRDVGFWYPLVTHFHRVC